MIRCFFALAWAIFIGYIVLAAVRRLTGQNAHQFATNFITEVKKPFLEGIPFARYRALCIVVLAIAFVSSVGGNWFDDGDTNVCVLLANSLTWILLVLIPGYWLGKRLYYVGYIITLVLICVIFLGSISLSIVYIQTLWELIQLL